MEQTEQQTEQHSRAQETLRAAVNAVTELQRTWNESSVLLQRGLTADQLVQNRAHRRRPKFCWDAEEALHFVIVEVHHGYHNKR